MTDYYCDKGKGHFKQDGEAAERVADIATLIRHSMLDLKQKSPAEAPLFETGLKILVLSSVAFEVGDFVGNEPTGKLKEIIENALKNDGE